MVEIATRLGEAFAAGVPPHVELQREVDSMQAVYTQERRELEAMARELAAQVQEVRSRLLGAPDLLKEGLGGEPPPPAEVRWQLDGVDAFQWEAPDPSSASRRAFRLPELPGVDLGLSFHPFGGGAATTQEGSLAEQLQWRLALSASGPLADGLRLRVRLAAALLARGSARPPPSPRGAPEEADAGEGDCVAKGDEAGQERLGELEGELAGASAGSGGAAEVACSGVWPKELRPNAGGGKAPEPGPSLLLDASIQVLEWQAPGITACSDWLDVAGEASPHDSEAAAEDMRERLDEREGEDEEDLEEEDEEEDEEDGEEDDAEW